MRSATTIADRRHFRALLIGSAEGIASNILADRLKRLIDSGILTRGAAAESQRSGALWDDPATD